MTLKITKVIEEITKTKEKIAKLQELLPKLERRRAELENAEIIRLVRSSSVAPEHLAGVIQSVDVFRRDGDSADCSDDGADGESVETGETDGTSKIDRVEEHSASTEGCVTTAY